LKTLWEESKGLRKSEFRVRLKSWIQATLPKQLDSLEYGHGGVRAVLLLHNILTTLESREEHFRFPFNRYKKQKWDVEHIHSVREKRPESERHQREWLSDAAGHLRDEQLKAKAAMFLNNSEWVENEFGDIYLEVLRSFSEKGEPESINDLSNLALLDSGTNRGYGNAVFPAKRATIIEKEREGTFVPIATKNAFMKYYTNSVKEFTFWSEADRQAYFEAIQNTLESFSAEKKGQTQ